MKPIANIFFKKALEIIRPDIVNVHYPPLDDFVIKNRKKFGYKVVYYYHNITDPNMYAGYERERRILENKRMIKNVLEADKVIVNSDFTKNYLLSEFSINSTVITPGIDFQVFRKKERKLNLHHPALLHVGRIVKHKGIDLLLNAFEQVLKKIPQAHLYIIGKFDNDDYSELVKQRAEEIGNIYMLGHLPVEDVIAYYKSADLFTCASLYEGFGMPFMEAQASGLSCVGFNTASIPEVVKDNETGILVKTKDTKTFSKAVIELLSNNKKKEQFSKNGIEHARNYDWAKIVDKLYEEYNKI
jgi:glycosyltransferase involved in cell wall biosynthesis